ncbi:MAG: hypothetical protein ACE5HS_06065 [bacterium]
MKTGILFIYLMATISLAAAQELIIQRGDQSFPVEKRTANLWYVQMDGKDYYLMERRIADRRSKIIDSLKAVIERHEKVLAINDTLLAKYSTFEKNANEHIAAQKELLSTADSLYLGYKAIYNDLKKAIGWTTFSLTGGVGWADPPESRSRPMVSLGVGFQNWIALYQVGKNYNGLSVLYRLPLGF